MTLAQVFLAVIWVGVTASSVRMICQTIQGWRPTSVTIQPDSIAT